MVKKVLILAEDDFRDEELIYPYYRMIEEGLEVVVAARGKKRVVGKFGLPVAVDAEISECVKCEFDAVIIPGGFAPDKLRTYEEVLEVVRAVHLAGGVVAAICHAGWVLASADVIKDKKVTSYVAIKDDMVNAGGKWEDSEVVVDQNVITSRKPSDLPAFCREIIKKLQ